MTTASTGRTQGGRWTPQPRAPGMSYISAEMKAAIDLSESRVGRTEDEATWDMAASLGLSQQLTTGAVLGELVEQGHDIVVCTADLGRPTQVIGFGRKYPDRYFNFGIAERNMIGAAAGLMTPDKLAAVIASVPMGRPGHAHEVAGCALFLACDLLSSYVTGSEIDVNGGSHIH